MSCSVLSEVSSSPLPNDPSYWLDYPFDRFISDDGQALFAHFKSATRSRKSNFSLDNRYFEQIKDEFFSRLTNEFRTSCHDYFKKTVYFPVNYTDQKAKLNHIARDLIDSRICNSPFFTSVQTKCPAKATVLPTDPEFWVEYPFENFILSNHNELFYYFRVICRSRNMSPIFINNHEQDIKSEVYTSLLFFLKTNIHLYFRNSPTFPDDTEGQNSCLMGISKFILKTKVWDLVKSDIFDPCYNELSNSFENNFISGEEWVTKENTELGDISSKMVNSFYECYISFSQTNQEHTQTGLISICMTAIQALGQYFSRRELEYLRCTLVEGIDSTHMEEKLNLSRTNLSHIRSSLNAKIDNLIADGKAIAAIQNYLETQFS